ncbi:PE-PPE domain-containing protein [Mycobacterium sp. PSTR-4-N]|uniref:PE-PPE domain-containing protein n=1 Tax=Mycobacterium sp. PSTR-4-N TaxID=2917745 RepID=UPI001F1532AC|nr:PE-PPE domain-containing protein [Mycobacterium sp. PSTR-4-N]MCG7593716.1 PE-PPE domain-containing protein [Mycobacterium sp. PSTR-4-N]
MSATVVLTVPPWLAGVRLAAPIAMAMVCKRYAVTDGRRHVPVPTQVAATRTAVPSGADILNNTIKRVLADPDTDDIVVMGASLGSVIISRWLDSYGRQPGRPSPSRLRCVLLANPIRGTAHGAPKLDRFNGAPVQPTPTNTGYKVDDVARKYDKYAFPAGKPSSGVHSNYFAVDLKNLKGTALTPPERVGSTTYWVVP